MLEITLIKTKEEHFAVSARIEALRGRERRSAEEEEELISLISMAEIYEGRRIPKEGEGAWGDIRHTHVEKPQEPLEPDGPEDVRRRR